MPSVVSREPLLDRLFPPVLHPPFTVPAYFQGLSVGRTRLRRALSRMLGRDFEPVVVERVVEIPFVFRQLDCPTGSRVLDFGATGSQLALHLASVGYSVTSVDLRPYPLTHPNLKHLTGDFLEAALEGESFDAALAISAIEHCGLAAYGEAEYGDGDMKIMRKIRRLLAPGGRLLLTVPYGLAGQTSWYRVYDAAGLANLLEGFRPTTSEYYSGIGRVAWTSAPPEEVARIDSIATGFAQGVACVAAVKV